MNRLATPATVVIVGLMALVLCSPLLAAETPPAPNEFEGLEAWYRVEFSEADLGAKGSVDLWPDLSGKGHDV